ncbi:hypothetical protein A2U01_0063203, partial [Trifolium medium]|nr:hypothetical protein [Trifolium medium]
VNPLIKQFISKVVRSGASCESKAALISTVNLGHPKWFLGEIHISQDGCYVSSSLSQESFSDRIDLSGLMDMCSVPLKSNVVVMCWVGDPAFPN